MQKHWILLPLLAALTACSSKPKAEPASQPVLVATATQAAAAAASSQAAGPKVCASTEACGPGAKCSTETGACDKPPGCTPDGPCAQVCYGVCVSGTARLPSLGFCKEDTDCKLHSSYCGGCKCFAMPVAVTVPECKEPPVNCVRDPCSDLAVTCVEGKCTKGDSAPMK